LYGRELDTSLDLVTQPVWDGMEETEVPYSECLRLSLREAHDHARAALEASHDKRKLHYDKRRRSVSYVIGDLVRVRTHPKSDALANFTAKLAPLYSGPYRVTQVLSTVNYRLAKLDTGEDAGVFHVVNMQPFHTWDSCGSNMMSVPQDASETPYDAFEDFQQTTQLNGDVSQETCAALPDVTIGDFDVFTENAHDVTREHPSRSHISDTDIRESTGIQPSLTLNLSRRALVTV